MAELKTKRNEGSVEEFIASVKDDAMRLDCREIAALMTIATGEEPRMWSANIVGFCDYHYKYASGREGDWFWIGFSPRKQNLTIYLMNGFEKSGGLMSKLGKYKTGKSCLYIKRLNDIDRDVLRQLVEKSVEYFKKNYR